MNFIDILKVASEKQGVTHKEVKRPGYSTNLGKAKREKKEKPKGVNSAAVQAFLKKRDEEEQKQLAEARRKKAELMKARAEANTLNKMNNMIKRNHTKEAIFEVEGNERDKAKIKSPTASEKDDGVSFTRLRSETGGKERRAAITNVKRVQVDPHYVPKEERERVVQEKSSNDKSKHSSDSSKHSRSSHKHDESVHKHSSSHKARDKHKYEEKPMEVEEKSKPEVKKKKRPIAPPPMSFNDLLKIAEKKKTEPVSMLEVKKPKDKKERPKDERPMTQEEKDRRDRIKSKEYRYWLQTGRRAPNSDVGLQKPNPKAKKNSLTTEEPLRRNSVESRPSTSKDTNNKPSSSKSVSKPSTGRSSPSMNKAHSNSVSSSAGHSSKSVPDSVNKSSSVQASMKKLKLPPGSTGKYVESTGSSKSSSSKSSSSKISESKSSSTTSSKFSRPMATSSQKKASQVKGGKKPAYAEEHENILVCGGPAQSDDDEEEEEDESRKPQLSTWDRIYSSVHKKKQRPPMKLKHGKRVIESDSEYDSELDDFIEDEDDMAGFIDDSGADDYSKHIAAIFGYDKNKYRDYDDDDCRDMEANFSQIEKEEKISARIGMREDLEDMRMEEEELKRKALRKKQLAKKMRRG